MNTFNEYVLPISEIVLFLIVAFFAIRYSLTHTLPGHKIEPISIEEWRKRRQEINKKHNFTISIEHPTVVKEVDRLIQSECPKCNTRGCVLPDYNYMKHTYFIRCVNCDRIYYEFEVKGCKVIA